MSFQEIASKSLYVAFFMPLLGTALPAYGWFLLMITLACIAGKATLKGKDIIFLCYLAILFAAKVTQVGFPMAELLFRYFFGYVLVYVYCQVTGAELNVPTLIKVYCLEVLCEATLVNTILPATLWRSYPIADGNMLHATKFFGFYQRPYSVGANATISSVILVFLLLYCEIQKKNGVSGSLGRRLDWLAGITIFSFMSGGGMVFYLFYWGYRLNLYTKWKKGLALLFFVGLCIGLAMYASTLDSTHALSKISMKYFDFLIDFKLNQISTTLDVLARDSWYIGANYQSDDILLLWNDFSIRDLTHSLGFLGLAGFLIFLLIHTNRYNWMIPLLGFLCVFHYGTVFALPGAIILAYGLELNKRKAIPL